MSTRSWHPALVSRAGEAPRHLRRSAPPLVDADGRIRGRFNQMGAATGRLSQEQPNLQNIPVRSEEGRDDPQGVRLGRGPYVRGRRLLADRASHPGAISRTTPAWSKRSSRTSMSTPRPRHASTGSIRDDVTRRPTPESEDDQLRAALRHGGLRPRPAARDLRGTRPRDTSTRTSPSSQMSGTFCEVSSTRRGPTDTRRPFSVVVAICRS